MRALVTGGRGFVGTHLVRSLISRGETVRCLLRGEGAIPGIPVEIARGDILDSASLEAAMKEVKVVFHLAGIRRASDRHSFMEVNAEGTRRVCEAMVNRGVHRLVLCGSLAATGPSSPQRPRLESDPFAPEEWYGESKVEAERVALSYRGRMEVAIARPARILGPGDKENLAFFKLVRRGWLLSLKGGPRPLSMVDVEDVVELLHLLAVSPQAEGEAFFAAAPGTTTLEQLQGWAAEGLGVSPRTVSLSPVTLRALAAVADGVSLTTGHRLPLNRKLARQLLAPAWTCSGEKARQVLGFVPRRGLEESVRRSIAWYRAEGWL